MLESARSVSDLESATQKPRDEVEKWLSGAVSPHLGELRRLGKLLGRSPFFFMLPEPPSSTPTAVEFRRALRKDINEDERAVELQALRWGRRTQSVARDLLNSADLLGNATTWAEDIELDDQASPARAAEQVRVWLAWDTATQVNATSKSAAFKSLRAAVEERGVLVALRSAGTSRFCGFSLPDPVAPLIYVNKDYELGSVRSFTLMHELGHVLRGNRRVCYGGDKGVEQCAIGSRLPFSCPGSTSSATGQASRSRSHHRKTRMRCGGLQIGTRRVGMLQPFGLSSSDSLPAAPGTTSRRTVQSPLRAASLQAEDGQSRPSG